MYYQGRYLNTNNYGLLIIKMKLTFLNILVKMDQKGDRSHFACKYSLSLKMMKGQSAVSSRRLLVSLYHFHPSIHPSIPPSIHPVSFILFWSLYPSLLPPSSPSPPSSHSHQEGSDGPSSDEPSHDIVPVVSVFGHPYHPHQHSQRQQHQAQGGLGQTSPFGPEHQGHVHLDDREASNINKIAYYLFTASWNVSQLRSFKRCYSSNGLMGWTAWKSHKRPHSAAILEHLEDLMGYKKKAAWKGCLDWFNASKKITGTWHCN